MTFWSKLLIKDECLAKLSTRTLAEFELINSTLYINNISCMIICKRLQIEGAISILGVCFFDTLYDIELRYLFVCLLIHVFLSSYPLSIWSFL